MKNAAASTCMFVDIGGVLLTNGWDHHARKRAAANFKLEVAEMEDRHRLTFDTYEKGKLTLDEYLGRVVFYQKRPLFVQIAEGLGIRSILHTDYRSTCAKLASLGLQNDDGVVRATS